MTRQSFCIFLWVIVIAFSARISFDIPLTEINITGQTLSILCMALLSRPLVSIPAIVIYVLIGILGLPVFSEGNGGWDYFSKDGMGYFIGFIIAVITLSQMYWKNNEDEFSRNGINILMLQLLGSFIILFCGVIRLAFMMTFMDAVLAGFTPFILTAIAKSILGAVIIVLYYKVKAKYSF